MPRNRVYFLAFTKKAFFVLPSAKLVLFGFLLVFFLFIILCNKYNI